MEARAPSAEAEEGREGKGETGEGETVKGVGATWLMRSRQEKNKDKDMDMDKTRTREATWYMRSMILRCRGGERQQGRGGRKRGSATVNVRSYRREGARGPEV